MTAAEHEFVLTSPGIRMRFSASSDRGKVRTVNEDSMLVAPPLFLVADGMGGHSFGDRASQQVIETFSRGIDDGSVLTPDRVVELINESNTAVVALTSDDPDAVCGTTLAGVTVVEVGIEPQYHWMAFNVGDSRVYSWDGRRLEQVTVDHSAVQELLDLGEISAEEAIAHPHRNVITRAIGVGAEVDADIWLLPLGGSQTFLLCSDGLPKELDDDLIAGILADVTKLATGQELADRLVEAALAAGGTDNVTVVVVEAQSLDPERLEEETSDRYALPNHLEQTRPRKRK